jgi:hypothetical protein
MDTIRIPTSDPGFGTMRMGVSVVASDGSQKYDSNVCMYRSHCSRRLRGGKVGGRGGKAGGSGFARSNDAFTPLINFQPSGPGINAKNPRLSIY